MISFLLALVFSTPSYSAPPETIPEFKVDVYHAGLQWGLQLTPPAQHHFNLKAPMGAKINGKPSVFAAATVKESEIVFTKMDSEIKNTLSHDPRNLTETDSVTVSAFLCDNAKTVCVKKTVTTSLKPTLLQHASIPSKTAPLKTVFLKTTSLKTMSLKKDAHGFWMNQVSAALQEAQKTNKPLMIDFYGIWCPPCNQLNETVFPKAAFRSAAKNFVLLKLDADAETSWEMKSHFKVGGYPTIVFVKTPKRDQVSSLEEIDRVIDYYPVTEIVKRMNEAYVHRKLTLEEKTAAAKEAYSEDLKNLIFVRRDQKEDDSVKRYAEEGLRLFPEDTYFQLVALREPTQENPVLEPLLNRIWKARAEESTRSLLAAQDMIVSNADAFKEKDRNRFLSWAKDIVVELETRVNPKTWVIDGFNFSAADLNAVKVDLAEAMKDEAAASDARAKTIAAYRELIRINGSRDARGLNLEMAHYLYKNKEVGEAKKIYERLEKNYPTEFTFYYAATAMYLELKEFDTARAQAEKALQYSYGDNRLRSAERLLRVMIAQGQGAEAKARGEAVLAQTKDPKGFQVRTERYIQNLKKAITDAEGKQK